MNLVIGGRRFCPGPASSLLTVALFVLFVWLGLWQLDRAEEKRILYKEFLDRQTANEIDLSQLIYGRNDYKDILWRRASITGRFYENKQVLLDNQVIKGQPGYFVYTALQLESTDDSILVNRGWVAAGNDRARIPEIDRTVSTVTVRGVIKEEPFTGIKIQETFPEKMTEDIIRVQKLDLKEIEKVINKKLLPVILRLEPESEHGYIREWRLLPSGEEVNLGYAFQWFAFAIILLIFYLIVNLKKIE